MLKKAKSNICRAINDYFKWFAGKDSKEYTEDELVLYIPQYDAGKIKVKSSKDTFELQDMDGKEEFFSMYDPDNTNRPSNS